MRLTFLGTGTSGGVPSIGCGCDVCRSSDPHDKRLRCSALIDEGDTRLLIDCGPDFRQQILPFDFKPIDAVLLTHIHYDHVAGIDDIRPFCVFGPVHIYADQYTAEALRHTMPYCFGEHLYPGVPLLDLKAIAPHQTFTVGSLSITPFTVMHGKLPILGFRIGKLAYITDMKSIEPQEMAFLKGTETLVVNALRKHGLHHSHQLVDDAIDFARQIGARQTYLIHFSHGIGLHRETEAGLPEGIHLAYDGLTLDL